jgi:8-oxo-dGTP pyrophosphatase MutT (NUDIX family)
MSSSPLAHISTGAPRQVAAEPRVQLAALCTRPTQDGSGTEVLLITSRGTGRWILPKGWPMAGRSSAEAAAIEAWEEAGVRGRAEQAPLGSYAAEKITPEGSLPCRVQVFRLAVEEIADAFPEAGQRHRCWVPAGTAAGLVREPELQELLRRL